MKQIKLMQGDNIESLKKLPENSIDSIVTDAPYGLGKEQDMNIVLKDWLDKGYSEIKGKGFMGNVWDAYVPQPVFWKEAIRTLKPGGHTLCFFSSRTYDIGVMSMRLAGFEIRDTITWNFGSGFPKSHNIGKSYDKKVGNEREVVGTLENYQDKRGLNGQTENVMENAKPRIDIDITKGQSKWEGWGTALKPAAEYIVMARKPLSEKTIVDNVIRWGVGGINIDGCRIPTNDKLSIHSGNLFSGNSGIDNKGSFSVKGQEEGRFPANIIFDEVAAAMLDEQSGPTSQGHWPKGSTKGFGEFGGGETSYEGVGPKDKNKDKSGASRFFYVPKVGKKERNMGLDGFECEIKLTPTLKLIVKTDYNNKNLLWEKQDLKTKHVDTDKLHQKDTEGYGVPQNEDKLWNIDMYGNYIMERFQQDFKSITEMEINSTTIYQTLNLLIQKNTKNYIQELYGEKVKDINFVENVEKKSTKMTFTLIKDIFTQSVNHVSLEEMWSINVKENKSNHPTLKPINLMNYLCRLVTPPGGIVLDPFMGSGSTGISACLEGFRFVGMELDEDYFKIAEARINSFEEYRSLLKQEKNK